MSAGRVIATVSQKGGVGKTFIAKVFFDLSVIAGRTVAAWDLDASTGTFAVYDDAIKTFDLSNPHETYSWLDDCHSDVADILIDVPGGRIDDLLRTFGDNGVHALVSAVRSSGREFVVVNPIGVTIAETVTAQVVLNAFAGTDARIVIVKNGRSGNAEDFVIYDGVDIAGERRYGATGDLAMNVGAETLFLPSLAPRLLAQIDAERLRLCDASGKAGAERLGRLNSVEAKFRGTSLSIDGLIPQRSASR
jgi:hypothetical protein